MPVEGVNANPAANAYAGFSIGADAKANAERKDAQAATELTDAQKEQIFLEKMNKGQKLDREPVTPENQGKLGKDDFMKLLIATLKYQDPSSPMDTQKLLEQTSVMTNMEQMIKMTQASQKAFEAQKHAQGSTLVGRTVVYDTVDSAGKAVTTAGKVDAVEFLAQGQVLLHVGKEKLKMDEVLGVVDSNLDSPENVLSAATQAGTGTQAGAATQAGTGTQVGTATQNPPASSSTSSIPNTSTSTSTSAHTNTRVSTASQISGEETALRITKNLAGAATVSPATVRA